MLDDALKSIRAYLYDRASSPLLGSFACSWLAWHYRAVLVVTSGKSVEDKFAYLDETLYPCWEAIAIKGVGLPLMTALAYIFVYPIPALKTYEYARKQQKKMNDRRRAIEDETLLSAADSRALRHNLLSIEEVHEQSLQKKDARIKTLETQLEEETKRANEAAKHLNEAVEELMALKGQKVSSEEDAKNMDLAKIDRNLKHQEQQVLEMFTPPPFSKNVRSDQYTDSQVAVEQGISIPIASYHLKNLQGAGLIEATSDDGGEFVWELSDKGVHELIKRGKIE